MGRRGFEWCARYEGQVDKVLKGLEEPRELEDEPGGVLELEVDPLKLGVHLHSLVVVVVVKLDHVDGEKGDEIADRHPEAAPTIDVVRDAPPLGLRDGRCNG